MQHSGLDSIRRIPELAALLEHADHVDVKTVIGSVDLRTFVANMLNYQPDWVMALYGVRAVFIRFLGMRQKGHMRRQPLASEDVTHAKRAVGLILQSKYVQRRAVLDR